MGATNCIQTYKLKHLIVVGHFDLVKNNERSSVFNSFNIEMLIIRNKNLKKLYYKNF